MASQKRKRSCSHAGRASSLVSDTASPILNPHAHSESTLKQLRIAGLTEAALLPSTYIPQFPHRPIRPSHNPPRESENEDEAGKEEEEEEEENDDDSSPGRNDTEGDDSAARPPTTAAALAARARRAKAMRAAQDTHLALLTAALRRLLDTGDVARAKRAFGLVRRSEVRGKAVDLRRGGLWEFGVEVLMREGEEAQAEAEAAPPGRRRARRRWGAAANMPAVRAYLEALVRLYPYNRLRPHAVSAADFYPVLFACEVYNTWVEHRLALDRLEEEEAGEDGDQDGEAGPEDVEMADEDERDGEAHLSGRERRLRRAKGDLSHRALATMREVATRMDALLVEAPCSHRAEMWRLRGMVALYLGDLSVASPPRTDCADERGARVRDEERERAGRFFRTMRDLGGRVDAFTEKWLDEVAGDDSGADEEDEDMESAWSGLPVFSSFPVR